MSTIRTIARQSERLLGKQGRKRAARSEKAAQKNGRDRKRIDFKSEKCEEIAGFRLFLRISGQKIQVGYEDEHCDKLEKFAHKQLQFTEEAEEYARQTTMA